MHLQNVSDLDDILSMSFGKGVQKEGRILEICIMARAALHIPQHSSLEVIVPPSHSHLLNHLFHGIVYILVLLHEFI